MRTRNRPRRSHIGKVTKAERNRIKRKRKMQHTARMEYWEKRGVKARLHAELLDPNKNALALLELANVGLRRKVGRSRPMFFGHRGQRR